MRWPINERFASTSRATCAGQTRGLPASFRYSRAAANAMFIPLMRVSRSLSRSALLGVFDLRLGLDFLPEALLI